jgi:4-hydroxybenzoyl-CoA reductase subunit beta
MLRLPPFRHHRPDTVAQAVSLLAEYAGDVMPMAGGTDLVPNMKHRLFTPGHVVALKGIEEMRGIHREGDEIVIGAGETLTAVAANPLVRLELPALADAAEHVAGPQLRNMATIGGNLCLDTRCTYYNQTEFWRSALGYCLKKDGDVCHVTRVGKKCVAAHSADTPPVLMTLDAVADLVGPEGERTIAVRDFFVTDGIWNTKRQPGELVARIRIPVPSENTVMAYRKLRQRKSIDFPLLTVAVAAERDGGGVVSAIRGVVTGLGSRPRELTGWEEIAAGSALTEEVIDALSERAYQQCRPLENIIVDPDWRRGMVPVQVRRALQAL